MFFSLANNPSCRKSMERGHSGGEMPIEFCVSFFLSNQILVELKFYLSFKYPADRVFIRRNNSSNKERAVSNNFVSHLK